MGGCASAPKDASGSQPARVKDVTKEALATAPAVDNADTDNSGLVPAGVVEQQPQSPSNRNEAAGDGTRKSRARRLSAAVPQGDANAAAATPTQPEETRKRRLSVVPYDDKGKAPNLASPAADVSLTTAPRSNQIGDTEGLDKDVHPIIQSIGCISSVGKEPGTCKKNQDMVMVLPRIRELDDSTSIFAVLDGHGTQGDVVAETVARNLMKRFATYGLQPDNLSRNLWRSFCDVHEDLVQDRRVDCTFSGATVTLSVMQNRVLTTAWVGDSRAVLGRQDGDKVTAYDLTNDHKPSLEKEQARIEQAGGRVCPLLDVDGEPIGPARVWLQDAWLPGLAMSRSIGDAVAATCGVTCAPDISVVEITEQDRFAIWASDGVWEFIDSQAAVDMVAKCADAPSACEALTQAAKSQWEEHEVDVSDDISCVVVFFSDTAGASAA